MAEHTIGPWRVYDTGGELFEVLAGSKGAPLEIALVSYDEGGGVIALADTCLIAAAPDLLAACKVLLDHDPDGCINGGHNCTCHVCYARAAIAKAEGGTDG